MDAIEAVSELPEPWLSVEHAVCHVCCMRAADACSAADRAIVAWHSTRCDAQRWLQAVYNALRSNVAKEREEKMRRTVQTMRHMLIESQQHEGAREVQLGKLTHEVSRSAFRAARACVCVNVRARLTVDVWRRWRYHT